MYDRALAQARIDDLVREAQQVRMSRQTRRGRTEARQSLVRRAGSAVASALLWPIRH
jgi:hypothetical protein